MLERRTQANFDLHNTKVASAFTIDQLHYCLFLHEPYKKFIAKSIRVEVD